MSVVVIAAAVFCIGLYGVLTRRDLVVVLACVELMLGGASLQFVGFAAAGRQGLEAGGVSQAFALVLLVLAAAEAAVGLALVLATVRATGKGRVEDLTEVRG